ncbi:MAG: RidA family protein [Planctomycetota bacterium]|jgi:enamine deaminase RidA (YjgF/YER057c/UK114 family)
MTRQRISSGSRFEEQAAYSRAVVDGDDVFVAGTTGYDYATMTIEADVVAQCRQTLDNVEAALRMAGASLQDVLRVTYILPEPSDFEKCWPVLRERFGDAPPAATMLSARLVNDDIKIEIEVTARKRR